MLNQRSRAIAVFAVAALVLVWGGTSTAADNIAVTKHNLSLSSGGINPEGTTIEDYGEICVYCHTPHGGQNSAPLWNRAFSTATYDMYDNTHSSTIDMIVDSQPTGVSMACLSCHDGTIGLDVITNPPNGFGGTVPPTGAGNVMPIGSFALLDTDLRNDHPVSVTYDTSLDPSFHSKADVVTGGLRLFGDGTTDKVQCASCHNPHDSTNTPFLRISNSGSSLCLTCHIK